MSWLGLLFLGTEVSLTEIDGGGLSAENFDTNWAPGYTDGHTFVSMFGLFFPGMAGVLAGSNRSAALGGE
jgi:hypothetical protein